MRFKLDENLPVELAPELRAMGHDTDTVADEGLCGEVDPVVVEAAAHADRILLTLDKGIADARGHRNAGVVLFRPDSAGRRAVLSFVCERISALLAICPPAQASAFISLRCAHRTNWGVYALLVCVACPCLRVDAALLTRQFV